MSYYSRYDKGDWKAICDSCGREFKASKLRQRWDGLMVCQQDWETRHPQDFVRGVADIQTVPWVRDEVQDVFLPVCDTVSAIAGIARAGCAQAGNSYIPGNVPSSSFNVTNGGL